MFQFRRFPAYAYFVQRTLTEYCSAGFPHSVISGSKPMCGSPKLIAACHVLHRFLMPRHSPCALISLTSSPQTSYLSLPCKHESSIIPLRLLSVQNPLRWVLIWFKGLRASTVCAVVQTKLVLSRIMQASEFCLAHCFTHLTE